MFGLIDIHGSAQKLHFDLNFWNIKKSLLQRHFTVRAQTEAEYLTLSYDNLHRMSQEFPEIYDKLMDDTFHLLRRVLLTKLLAMKHCRAAMKQSQIPQEETRRFSLTSKDQMNNSGLIRLRTMVSNPNTNNMVEFDPFNLE